jgi:hypothetical protein
MRLVTRGDMDGLACAVIISKNEPVDGFLLIHPQDITNKRVKIHPTDIIANLPYHPDCALWFDHHKHTATYPLPPEEFKGAHGEAASTARLVYDYYGGSETMPELAEMVRETDRLDSADLTPEDVTNPKGYIRIGFTLDSRTGLGPFEDYMMTLLDLLGRATPPDEVLEHPAVARRWQMIKDGDQAFREAIVEHSRIEDNVIITDFRSLDPPPVGNRFLIYALFPAVNVSLRVHWGPQKQFVVAAVGHSIFNRTCRTNVGELAARYGGGGHPGAGSIPLRVDSADEQLAEIIAELRRNG